ncbi:MAG: aminotransferase class I/II-fold pyridoxal phosphate-dependent enzyme [Bacteroidia bacterium]
METFVLERIQSLYENTVDYNLTESGVHPYSLKELLNPDELNALMELSLGYGQTNGSIELREAIAQLYPAGSVSKEQVLVTNGSSEANFIGMKSLLKAGDEVLVMLPNYLQIWGIVEDMGCVTKGFNLKAELDWAPDISELFEQISPRTKMIALCHPNNPTGAVLTESEMAEIVRLAESVGAWIYADEIYRGAELDGVERPSFIGMYDKVMVNGGLSKAYALPGLRVGWLVGPKEIIDEAWSYHDYTSITASVLSHTVAARVLQPDLRLQILDRTRHLLGHNLDILQNWHDKFGNSFEMIPPQAGGMAFMSYRFAKRSAEISDYLRENHSVFVVPGSAFGMEGYLRLGIGAEEEYFRAGLVRVEEGLRALQLL